MTFPMGLCPDSKRNLNPLSFLKKNQNSNMFDRGVSLFNSTSGCSADIVSQKDAKHYPFFSQSTSFHARTIPSFDTIIVGGFLGSKSQCRSGRSGNSPQFVWDLICTELAPSLFRAASDCMMPFTSGKQCYFSSAPPPPKKKFAKEESCSNSEIIDSIEFPSVIDLRSQGNKSEDSPKQSYADVAKAPSCKPSTSGKRAPIKDIGETTARRTSGNNRRRSQQRSARRRLNRLERAEDLLLRSKEKSSLSECESESPKDRLRFDEKGTSRLNSFNTNRSSVRGDRQRKSSNSNKQDFKSVNNSESHNRRRRHPNFRSNCDNKSGTRARNLDCDIDMINWRTGEPIVCKMGSMNVSDMNDEDFPNQHPPCEGVTSDRDNDGDFVGEQRNLGFSAADATWPEPQNGFFRCRQRSISSECSVDSEDSFIVFQSGAPSDSLSDLASDWSDCDSDDSYESDSDSFEEVDHCDGGNPSSQRLKEVNDRWQKEEYESELGFSQCQGRLIHDSKDGNKKVCFDESKTVVHRMLAWDFAYRASRVGPWEEIARDRGRFKTRIQQFESIISPVLTSDHRDKIWKRLSTQSQ